MIDTAVRIVYLKELRSALRDRSIVVNGLLLPVFLYPVMLWLMFTGLTFAEGLAEGAPSRVAVHGLPPEHAEILDSLRAADAVQVVDPVGDGADDVAGAEDALARGEIDLVAEFLPPEPAGPGLQGNFEVRLSYDRSLERSRRAHLRVEGIVERHRQRWLAERADALGLPRAEVEGFRVAERDVATRQQLGTRLLSATLPLFLVVMVALGCFVPAIDTTAGERERSTWETTMTVAVPRGRIVVAKYLYVATLGAVAGVLNVTAMFLSMGAVMRPLFATAGRPFEFELPWAAFPVMTLGAAALALFFAAAMMILASFARTFKEGQGMVTPVYWMALLPMLLGQGSEATLTPATAAIPVANVAMMIRDAIRGVFHVPLIAEALAVDLLAVLACLALARSVLRAEEFLIGAYDGSLVRFLRSRGRRVRA